MRKWIGPERGPEGRFHWPVWHNGCWRGKSANCCYFCHIRILVAPLRHLSRPLAVITVSLFSTLFIGIALHELAHITWYYIVTGGLPVCDSGFILTIQNGFLWTCTGDLSSLGKTLSGPVVGGLFGIGIMYLAKEKTSHPRRTGLFAGGILLWVTNSLYGLGWLHGVAVENGDVVLLGDGVVAILQAGYAAQIPGLFLLLLGMLLVAHSVQFREPSD